MLEILKVDMIVFIDSNTLGLICNPNINPAGKKYNSEAAECEEWFATLSRKSIWAVTSDICDYEIRRGLLSAVKSGKDALGLELLNNLRTNKSLDFLPVTFNTLELAADLWAEASHNNKPTSSPENIDADMIISAHYRMLQEDYPNQKIIVVTKNLRHLSIFCEASHWKDIN